MRVSAIGVAAGLAGLAWLGAGAAAAARVGLESSVASTRADLEGQQATNLEATLAVRVSAAELRRKAGLEAQHAAHADSGRHLRLNLGEGWGELHEGDFPLRRFDLAVGAEPPPRGPLSWILGEPLRLVPVLPVSPGVYKVRATWGPHAVPIVGLPPPIEDAWWPDRAEAPERVWDAAAIGDWLMYSATPPIPGGLDPARLGTLRVGEVDMANVLPNLPPGAPVYAW